MQCPSCNKPLSSTRYYEMDLDLCKSCKGVWFDTGELKRYLENSIKVATQNNVTQVPSGQQSASRRFFRDGFCPKCNTVATCVEVGDSGTNILRCDSCKGICAFLSQMKRLREWYISASSYEKLQLFGFKKENLEMFSGGDLGYSLAGLITDENPLLNFPAFTLSIISVNIILYVWTSFFPETAKHLILIPETYIHSPIRHFLTIFSSMFMHANLSHLIGNMYFLWVFGDNLEDRIGRFKFVVTYLLCGIIASMIYSIFTPNPEIPVLGASGAVSGILGGYLILYPKMRLNIFTMIYFQPIQIRLPVWFYIGIWFFGLQVFHVYTGSPGVAWTAHIGGFVCGVVILYTLRRMRIL